jgi:hypothetical protein
MARKKAKDKNPAKSRLHNEDHDKMSKAISHVENNIFSMNEIVKFHSVSPKIKTALKSLATVTARLKSHLKEEYQEQNKPEGPYV